MHGAFALRIVTAVGLMAATGGPALPQVPSAEDVFARFCELDSQGGQLTSDGWQKIAALFVNPGTPRHDRIIVTDRGGRRAGSYRGGFDCRDSGGDFLQRLWAPAERDGRPL